MIKAPTTLKTSFPGAIENTTISLKSFLSVLVGLAILTSAVYFLHIEESLNLLQLCLIAFAAFTVYAFTPVSFRLPFLFAVNAGAMMVLFGPIEGAILLLYGLILFVILNLPFSVRIRTVILVLFSLMMAFARLQIFSIPYGNILLPILGGLFMFRSILFLYEQQFIKKQESIWMRLNYFFLLPNLIFVIFPIVDYKTFINNYYSKLANESYRKGVLLMAKGVFHLLLYRFIYYYFVPNPNDIDSVYGYLQLIVTTYALIVRIAGIFHFSAGMICLFGFDLPPTFNHYFFADSFSDLWRRINMYWRNFMIKVFYYPVYFKLKHLGTTKAIAISILISFAFNWFLHAYQWFWVRGSFLITLQDTTFWAIFGITVMLNSVYEAMPRKKKQSQSGFHLKSAMLHSLRVIGIFMFMSFLWSWWTVPSVSAWVGMLNILKTTTISDVINILAGFVVLLLAGSLLQFILYQYDKSSNKISDTVTYNLSILGIFILATLAVPSVANQIGTRFNLDVDPVLHTRLNAADRELQFKGYYDTMLSGNQLLSTPLDEVQQKRPDDWLQLHTFGALIKTNDLITKQLKPNLNIQFKGANFQTNNLGLRDRPIEKQRPPNTLRIALLGASIEMGTGVTTEQTYENLVEDQLNEKVVFPQFEKVEIVNFAVAGIHLPQHIARVDKMVPDYNPQVIIYTAHSDEARRIMSNMYRVYIDSLQVEYEYINNLFAELNLPRTIDEATFVRTFKPRINEFIGWGLSHIKAKAEAMGAIPVWMFVPSLDGKKTPEQDEKLYQQAKDMGFLVLDLKTFNGTVPEQDIILGSWDRHPNALGHQLLAKKMYKELIMNKELLQRINETHK